MLKTIFIFRIWIPNVYCRWDCSFLLFDVRRTIHLKSLIIDDWSWKSRVNLDQKLSNKNNIGLGTYPNIHQCKCNFFPYRLVWWNFWKMNYFEVWLNWQRKDDDWNEISCLIKIGDVLYFHFQLFVCKVSIEREW